MHVLINMKTIILAGFFAAIAISTTAQTLDSFSIIRTTLPYRFYVRIALPHDGYKFSRFIERNTQSVMNTQLFNFLFKDCPGGTMPAFYDTTIDVLVTQYTSLFEVKVNILLDENFVPPCALRDTMQRTDSLYMTGNEVMRVPEFTEPSIAVYPNPVQRMLHIQTETHVYSYIITGMDGIVLMKGNDIERPLNITLPDGMYLLRLISDRGSITRRFAVANSIK